MRSTVLEHDIAQVVEMVRQGKRLDGRGFEEMRAFTVEVNKYLNAEGSARVVLGETEVVAGLKMEVGKPYPDNPDAGAISVGAEMLALAHSEYESGAPSFDEIEVARVVDRGIREGKALDFEKFCIKSGEAVWIAYLDFYAINSDGNLFDAGSIACLATLMNGKKPKIDANNKIIDNEFEGKLELKRLPLLTTFVKIAGKILVDPTYLEEKAAETRFSVATTEDGLMSAMQKGMNGSFTLDEVNYMIDVAFKVGKETRKQIQKL